LVLTASVLGGCTTRSAAAPAPSDGGNIPPSAYGQCDPAAAHDAAGFTYAASCSPPATEAGAAASCAQWSESADGDWTSFAESCITDGGAISTVPCPDAGVSGVCTYAATCTTQVTMFYYGAAAAAAAKPACVASPGASFAL
jgi:hypothetical protein